eukprot:COSAG01_NODE_6927_length_3436_cov_20.147438_2_plen_146_part_00
MSCTLGNEFPRIVIIITSLGARELQHQVSQSHRRPKTSKYRRSSEHSHVSKSRSDLVAGTGILINIHGMFGCFVLKSVPFCSFVRAVLRALCFSALFATSNGKIHLYLAVNCAVQYAVACVVPRYDKFSHCASRNVVYVPSHVPH